MGSPPPNRWRPPMVMVSSARSPASSLTLLSRAARSGLPGGYCLIGSLTGGGTVVTASMTASLRRPGIVDGHSMVARGGHRSHRRGRRETRAQSCRAVTGSRSPRARLAYRGGEQRDTERLTLNPRRPQGLQGGLVRREERFDGQFLD